MDGKFNGNPLICEQDDTDINNPESGPDSPSSMVNDMKMTSTSSPKKGKRGMHKRVVSIPIKDVEGSRLKGENSPPPSDSWAWRKYGQKPIKGSPYPRGYYRCSSSKGCPARKQVERSRVDPSMLLITYSCEHNHPWPPPSRNNHHHHHHHNNHPSHQDASPQLPTTAAAKPEISSTAQADNPEPEPEEKFTNLSDESLITAGDEFSWFGDMETNSSTMLQSHIFTDRSTADIDMAASLFFPMREEDESLFADLGELPECSAVFRHHRSGVGPEVQIC